MDMAKVEQTPNFSTAFSLAHQNYLSLLLSNIDKLSHSNSLEIDRLSQSYALFHRNLDVVFVTVH